MPLAEPLKILLLEVTVVEVTVTLNEIPLNVVAPVLSHVLYHPVVVVALNNCVVAELDFVIVVK